MLTSWLEYNKRNRIEYKFDVYDISEKQSKNTIIRNYMRDLLIWNIVDPELLKSIALKYGYENAYSMFVSSMIPLSKTVKKGRFGEILAADVLTKMFNYEVPIQKMRYLLATNENQHGTDVIGIVRDSTGIREICYLESKLRSDNNVSSAGKDALKQLRTDLGKSTPVMLSFIIERLFETRDPLAYILLDYMMNRESRTISEIFRIAVICERNGWTETCLKRLNEEIASIKESRNITIDIIRISSLDQFIRDVFNCINMEVDMQDE